MGRAGCVGALDVRCVSSVSELGAGNTVYLVYLDFTDQKHTLTGASSGMHARYSPHNHTVLPLLTPSVAELPTRSGCSQRARLRRTRPQSSDELAGAAADAAAAPDERDARSGLGFAREAMQARARAPWRGLL